MAASNLGRLHVRIEQEKLMKKMSRQSRCIKSIKGKVLLWKREPANNEARLLAMLCAATRKEEGKNCKRQKEKAPYCNLKNA